jgi:hypothetical protein
VSGKQWGSGLLSRGQKAAGAGQVRLDSGEDCEKGARHFGLTLTANKNMFSFPEPPFNILATDKRKKRYCANHGGVKIN